MATQVTPEVLWAQRSSTTDPAKNYVYLTISVPDVPAKELKLNVTSTGLTFTGHSDSLKKTYHLDIQFFAEIDEKETTTIHTGKNVELKLRKKELKEEFWPRLLKDKAKVHYLKTDFDKWVDEDEQEEAPEDDMGAMGGMGGMGGGMGGMPGMGDMSSMMGGMGGGDFGGIDFSKLGGGEGLGAGDDDDDEDDEDDEEMPGLEGEEESSAKGSASSSKAAPKIEEVN